MICDRPTAEELVVAVREFLESELMPELDGRLAFHARVSANVLGIVEREFAATCKVDATAVAAERDLADEIRSGARDDRFAETLAEVKTTVLPKLEIDHPGYARRGDAKGRSGLEETP